jgi:hypothetical protein
MRRGLHLRFSLLRISQHFFFTEQGRQPCVQPQSGGPDIGIYVPQ